MTSIEYLSLLDSTIIIITFQLVSYLVLIECFASQGVLHHVTQLSEKKEQIENAAKQTKVCVLSSFNIFISKMLYVHVSEELRS